MTVIRVLISKMEQFIWKFHSLWTSTLKECVPAWHPAALQSEHTCAWANNRDRGGQQLLAKAEEGLPAGQGDVVGLHTCPSRSLELDLIEAQKAARDTCVASW